MKYSLILTNETSNLETLKLEFKKEATTREIAEALAYNLAKARAIMINNNARIGFSFSKKFSIDVRIGTKIHSMPNLDVIVNGSKAIESFGQTFTPTQQKDKFGEVRQTKAQNFERKANKIFANICTILENARGEAEETIQLNEAPQMKFIGA